MITHKSILAFIFLISISQLQSCYTESSQTQALEKEFYSKARATGASVIEGTVGFEEGGTREIHFHTGYILKNYIWKFNYPSYRYDAVYLTGTLNNSYRDKQVLILGTYKTDFGNELNHYKVIVSFNINKIVIR
ncbi:MAG: hypothetical protein ABR936_16450 [Bacteroidota bacterium]|jgi:hypothetical protein